MEQIEGRQQEKRRVGRPCEICYVFAVQIKSRFLAGETNKAALAREYGISASSVTRFIADPAIDLDQISAKHIMTPVLDSGKGGK